MSSIAIVTPWYGEALTGGAEKLMWEIATLLAARGHDTHVLTTCCRSFFDDWGVNHLAPGERRDHGVSVHRFPVDTRDAGAFNAANAELLAVDHGALRPGVSPVSTQAARAFVRENIHSSALYGHLREHSARFDAVILGPYLYGTTLTGLPQAGDRAILLPCLHDEAYAYLHAVADIFRRARRVLFISDGEAELAVRLCGPNLWARSAVTGSGIPKPEPAPSHVSRVGPIDLAQHRYVLYLGRRDATKNVDLLVAAFRGYRAKARGQALRLVLAGPGDGDYDEEAIGIHDLGLVSEADKSALLAHAVALAQPSANESYSRTMMEAWWHGRPVIVHAGCLATATAVERCGGGWMADSEAAWSARLAEIDGVSGETLASAGERGRAYALEFADWNRAIDKIELALRNLAMAGRASGFPTATHPTPRPLLHREVHQVLPGFAYGDAISNFVLALRDELRAMGYSSDIFAGQADFRRAPEARMIDHGALNSDAALIYHHSIGTNLADLAVAHRGPKVLAFYDITPASFFAPYDAAMAERLADGHAQLRALAPHFPRSFAISRHTAQALEQAGFAKPDVFPLLIDPGQFPPAPHPGVMRALQDGATNLLFVGRITPNKRQDELAGLLAEYLTLDPRGRLILAGGFEENDAYYRHVADTIRRLGLQNRVLMPGKLDARALEAFYRTAHAFVSLSEHEGFGVPLIEAMWYDLPVLAFKAAAVPETLGTAGVLINDKNNLRNVAALTWLLVHDRDIRKRVLASQRERREDFTRAHFGHTVRRLLSALGEDAGGG